MSKRFTCKSTLWWWSIQCCLWMVQNILKFDPKRSVGSFIWLEVKKYYTNGIFIWHFLFLEQENKLAVYTVERTQQKTNVPLLPPSGPLSIVHSSILPKGAKSCRTSSSVCCLLSIPANSFLSAQTKQWQLDNFNCCTANNETASR